MPVHSCLPTEVRSALEGLRSQFRWNHFLTFSWLVFLHMIHDGSLKSLQRLTSALSYDQMTRFLRVSSLQPQQWVQWLALQAMRHLPPPEDGVLRLVADCTWKPKRGKCIPGLAKGKNRSSGPWIVGQQILLVCYQWHSYRIPVAFALIRNKQNSDYKPPNAVLRELLSRIEIPSWAQRVVLLADAGFASKENLLLLQKWKWGYVLRLPRSWKLADGRSLGEVIRSTRGYTRIWLPSVNGKRRHTYHYVRMTVSLKHLGEVHLVIAKKRRNDGPKAVRVLVTNLDLEAKAVLKLYACRWYVEVLFKELKSGMSFGKQQLTGHVDQVENALGLSLAAYLVLLRLFAKQIPIQGSWSIFGLKHQAQAHFREKLYEISLQREVRKQVKKRVLACQPA